MMLSRRTFAAGLPAILSGATRQPNIVIVLCDDLGYGDLGCFGHPAIRTPNLDAFAKQGARLTDCYAAAPVCSPSRAGMLTGRTPDRVGIYDWIPAGSPMHLRASEVTFAKLLRDAGYATCHSGKWHCNGLFNSNQQPQPGDHGFQHWFSTQNNAGPSHINPTNFARNGQKVGPLQGHSSRLIVDEAVNWLKTVPQGKPYCLFVCFHSPHEPVATDAEFTGMYEQFTERGQAMYYGNVTQTDHEFGRLMRELDTRGQNDDTFVMFTSDNGPETRNRYPESWRSWGTPGPLRGMKLHLYEGGCRVPGIVRWRGIRSGSTVSEPVCGVDMLPTVCGLAGVRPPTDRKIDGTDMMPALTGKKIRRATPLHWHYYMGLGAPVASMRDGDWKVVGIDSRRGSREKVASFQPGLMAEVKGIRLDTFELYNLRSDLAEKNNLAEREPARLKAMADRLLKLQEEVRAEGFDWRNAVSG
jgi:arylsulfatase A